jgi:hypothetical protein
MVSRLSAGGYHLLTGTGLHVIEGVVSSNTADREYVSGHTIQEIFVSKEHWDMFTYVVTWPVRAMYRLLGPEATHAVYEMVGTRLILVEAAQSVFRFVRWVVVAWSGKA